MPPVNGDHFHFAPTRVNDLLMTERRVTRVPLSVTNLKMLYAFLHPTYSTRRDRAFTRLRRLLPPRLVFFFTRVSFSVAIRYARCRFGRAFHRFLVLPNIRHVFTCDRYFPPIVDVWW